ncbi:Ionotropic receptor 148 [Frankliniella occidentalis]|nr:Ionotropic receptor 148 [Frankliniella occidentalis]
MDVVLALAILCAGAPGALPALSIVDVPVSPEARGAAALLSAFLPPHKAGVLLVGRVHWANAFLRRLPRYTPRVLLTDPFPAYYTEATSLNAHLHLRHNILMVVADRPEVLAASVANEMPRIPRALLWTTVARTAEEVVLNRTFLEYITRRRMCSDYTVLALSAPDGTTTLYELETRGCTSSGNSVQEIDRWSPADQMWLWGSAPFHQFCDQWKPPPSPSDPYILITIANSKDVIEQSNLIEQHNRLPRKIIHLSRSYLRVNGPDYKRHVANRSMHCRLDAILYYHPLPPPNAGEISTYFCVEEGHVVAFVPSGLGAAANPFAAVLEEFSPPVWLSTGLAVLCTAATLACAVHRGRTRQLALGMGMALAPLLAQPAVPGSLPPARHALRPLLGLWLLVCLVVVAAYQGLLLRKLFTANPSGEINSLTDLQQSGLPVYASNEALELVEDLLPEEVRNRVTRWHFVNTRKLIGDKVVRARNASLIIYMDRDLKRRLMHWFAPNKVLHYFAIRSFSLQTCSSWTRGSPLGAAVAKIIRRSEQAGLRLRYHELQDLRAELAREKRTRAAGLVQTLSLRQMYPAFLFLVGGLVLGAAIFVSEWFIFPWTRSDRANAGPTTSWRGVRRTAGVLRPVSERLAETSEERPSTVYVLRPAS